MMETQKCFQVLIIGVLAIICLPSNSGHSLSRENAKYAKKYSTNQDMDVTENNRKSRFFNFLTVIQFSNSLCNGSNGLSGTCYLATECTQRGGQASGSCAENIAVCCIFALQTCGNTSAENCTYFQNPGFPSTYDMAQTCSIFISKRESNICQLKFDLLSFDTTPPVAGACNMDRFTISGQNANSVFPALCGLNTGQTLYTDVSSSQGPIIVSMTTAGSRARNWNIKITQIPCGDPNLAPANCLQYVTGASGMIKSFNYGTAAPAASLGYINDLRYNICIRKELGFCEIIYTNADANVFDIDATGPAAGEAGTGLVECDNDFLLLGSTRLCGDRLNSDPAVANPTINAPVTDSTNGPFIVEFSSDATVTGRGFMVDYTQMACTMMG